MAEETRANGSEGSNAAVDPAAVALALDGASRERADSFSDSPALTEDREAIGRNAVRRMIPAQFQLQAGR